MPLWPTAGNTCRCVAAELARTSALPLTPATQNTHKNGARRRYRPPVPHRSFPTTVFASPKTHPLPPSEPTSQPSSTPRRRGRRPAHCSTADTEGRKHELLRAVQETGRGSGASPDQRAAIEEAIVCVEELGAGEGAPLDLAALDGTWRLCYTSASDVLVLFEAAERLPLLQVGQIYQKFECKGRLDGGIVRNVVRWSIENLLE
ncbi:hypothetical protein ACQJBY_001802 [Aegilops geniculata]